MVTVEAMASGKPVVALGRGGVLEAVPPGEPRAAVFYDEPGEEALGRAITRFEATEHLTPHLKLRHWAGRFSESRFAAEMRALIDSSAADSVPAQPAEEEARRWTA